LISAVFRARSGSRTIVLEQNDRAGAKLSLTGGGRCNILPSSLDASRFVTSSSRNSLARILRRWPLDEAVRFFSEDAGITLQPEEVTGKVFASADGAAGVTRRLVRMAEDGGASFHYRSKVADLEPLSSGWAVRLAGGGTIRANRVIVATGGRSWPGTGSGGWGFRIAARLGHKIRPVYPALVPLRSSDPAFDGLSGIVVGVVISSVFEGRPFRVEGPLLFTHRGFSGPAVMDASHAVTGVGEGGTPGVLSVCWGGPDEPGWESALLGGKGRVLGLLEKSLPSRLASVLMVKAGLEPSLSFADLDRGRRRALLNALVRFPLPVSGHCGWDEAEVTGGGVALEEVRPDTLESRLHPGLHFAGEVLDAFGPVGGYNLYWAWLSGFTPASAGTSQASAAGRPRLGRRQSPGRGGI